MTAESLKWNPIKRAMACAVSATLVLGIAPAFAAPAAYAANDADSTGLVAGTGSAVTDEGDDADAAKYIAVKDMKPDAVYTTEGTWVTDEDDLFNVDKMFSRGVSITVDELDILLVRKGQDAMVTLDALQGRAFSGVITEVNTTASNEGGNSKYSAVVEMPRDDSMLGGMNASANITLEERKGILLIPAAALVEENGASLVYRTYDNQTERLADPAPVETGLSDGDQVQILSGLQEGDTVWYRYYDTLEIKGLTDGVPSR